MHKRIHGARRSGAVQHGPAEALDGMLDRNAAERPGAQRTFLPFDQFNAQAVIISQRQIRLADPLNFRNRNIVSVQAFLPEGE
ncbi:hypothetical protein D3C73_1539520 [compost metagenome]